MSYAQGDGWTIDIVRHPLSNGFQVCLEITDWQHPSFAVKHTRIIGNKFGYARRETAERAADRQAQRLWDKE